MNYSIEMTGILVGPARTDPRNRPGLPLPRIGSPFWVAFHEGQEAGL